MDVTGPPKARTLAELLPGLGGILSKEDIKAMTAKKQSRPAKPVTLTSEKVLKPMTIAEMRVDIQALKIQSPRILPQGATSNKKRWNSSVKVQNKVVSHTAEGQMKHSTVRKVLNFQQPKPKMARATNARMTMFSEKLNFLKPESKPKKSLHPQACNASRISGICQIPDTPLSNKPVKKRISVANKENISYQPIIIKKLGVTPKSSLRQRILASRIPDTPISNESWKSSCDDSFLQNEKNTELNDNTLENIREVSAPVSTPFKEYQNIKDFFNNSSDVMDDSSTAAEDNTIMCFDKNSVSKENSKREESVIVSLCDMLDKATVSDSYTKTPNKLDDLLKFENQTVNHLKMIENGIATLLRLKESQLELLKHVQKLISENQKEHSFQSHNDKTLQSHNDKTLAKTVNIPKMETPPKEVTPQKSPLVATCSVIKSCLKSPSYKIPKKNGSNIRKKVLFRSVPNDSHIKITPLKPMGEKALSMYMEMKESLNFLSTPVVKQSETLVPDTPAITSNNLQLQLEKLYGEC